MSRCPLVVVLFAAATSVAGCSKSAGNQEPTQQPITKVEVPGATRSVEGGSPRPLDERKLGTSSDHAAGQQGGAPPGGTPPGGTTTGGIDDAFRLKPEEGQLAIQVAGDAKVGQETIASVIVTPGPSYKINFEYPIKLTLEPATGVTLAKAEYKAGGHDKSKGDAEAFEEKLLKFAVKLVPSASGSFTINGSFKFAVCDKDQCLAKKEPIAIQVAAK